MTDDAMANADLPESVPGLIEWLTQEPGTPSEQVSLQLQALRRLKRQANEASQSYRLLHCLTGWLREKTNFQLLGASIDVIISMRAITAVMPLIDVALATNVAVFEGAEGRIRESSEEGLRLRSHAVRALGLLGDDRALVPLMSLLNNKDLHYRIRLDAAESLGRLGDQQAVDPLLNVVQDDAEASVYLKESTVKALGMLGDIRAVEPLLSLFEAKEGFKQKFQFFSEQILLALGKLSAPTDEKIFLTLTRAAADRSPVVRLAATESMGQTGNPAYLEPLQERLLDESMEVAQCALAGLYKLGGCETLRRLLTLEKLPNYLREDILDFLVELEEEEAEEQD